jgi:glycosyltransferase involved in cell wall biosynthesis
MKLAIVMPAYNEERRIGRTLGEYSKEFERLRKAKILDYRLIVVINSTTDNTENVVKKYKKLNKRIAYLNLKEGGKGYAVIQGFKEALKSDFDLIGFVDADMSTLPTEYYRLASQIEHYEGIIASRYLKNARVFPKPTLARRIVSRIYNAFIRILFSFPYRDTQCGAKIFKKYAIEKVINSLFITRWAFDVDLIYNMRKNNFKVKEAPTKWSDSNYSKIHFMRAGPLMALSMIRLRLLNSPLRDFVRVYGFLPDWMKIHNKLI